MGQILKNPIGRVALIGGGIVVVLIASIVGYLYFTGGSGKASGPIDVATLPPDPNATTFTIVQSGSEASFTMTEVLFGNHNTVVGKTDQVAGQFQVDFTNPLKSRVGEIKVDVNTLETDNDLRNRTLHGQILESTSSQNEFAIFETTSITGMPSTVSVGQTITLQLGGNLTIHDVTHAATFSLQVTIDSMTKLTGVAKTTVKYADYNISIPNVPSVTDVSPDTQLDLSFTAQPQS